MLGVADSENSKLAAFRRMRAFQGTDSETLKELAAAASSRVFEDGSILFREGDPAEFMLIVQEGWIKLYRTAYSGKKLTFTMATVGDTANGVAVMSGSGNYMTAEAVGKASVLQISRQEFLAFLKRQPSAAIQTIIVLSQSVQREHDNLMGALTEDGEHRLIHALGVLVKKFGPKIPLERAELAEFAGLRVETTIRILARLKQRGIISPSRERGAITITEPKKLERSGEF